MERTFVDKYGYPAWLSHFEPGTQEDGKDWLIALDEDCINCRAYKTESGALRWLAKNNYTEVKQ